ncbi:uncharacterized protein LOC126382031 isoform X2 [Pectinophora gossypiella]|uniref:uncharacterized protein LOC126382031 isoform X2 n=1 Tax=Pectinophora gossypiella TaxID=13191 RepID=UPI00214E5A93|nr:uncharacterized protein LOC126382031 isoform X2 [Pectinophora gossypiella]
MTSEVEALKTNEFLRRRKLRIQQVREQSKDIAKKIRQRACAEKFRHLESFDAAKAKEYLEQQDKLVKKLEHLCAKGLGNVGASHKKASQLTQKEDKPEKIDLSRQRGREAAAELRKKKQEELDDRKKSLDRKLQAREIANEISREKASTIASKLSKTSVKTPEDPDNRAENLQQQASTSDLASNDKGKSDTVTADMATQWDYEGMPNEWEPHIPTLSLPKDDSSFSPKTIDNKSERTKRPNLFALSDEMPSSLRGGLTIVPEEKPLGRPSLTLVSDYIQHRDLRLREPDTASCSKKPNDDLQSLKQTIMRTRAARAEVSAKGSGNEKPTKLGSQESALTKKSSVTMYNHSTRDLKDVPYEEKKHVVRDPQDHEDAYSQAVKENTSETVFKSKEHHKVQDMRSKVAMTKQNVEKEYKDTMAFLNSLPKDKSKPIRNAYKDEQQMLMAKESRQRKLQQEFRKIQRDCRRHPNTNSNSRRQSKVPLNDDTDGGFNARDFQYSWMPVPESDGNLAIHTIPTRLKEQKQGSAVKFSKIDTYHEYRSRHKHTPPTKDTASYEKQKVLVIDEESKASESSSSDSETSSVENMELDTDKKQSRTEATEKLSDAERIIICKIVDNNSEKKDKAKKKRKFIKEIAKSLSYLSKDKVASSHAIPEEVNSIGKRLTQNTEAISFEHLKEGVYKTVNENGDNVASVHFKDPSREASRIQHESGVNTTASRCPKFRKDRGCGCHGDPAENIKLLNASSNSTSTSSFKTATNDKGTSLSDNGLKFADGTTKLPELLDGGFIKLVDDKGHESGKFYVGATGFLKDDAYEVVIQLRKKGDTATDKKDTQSEAEDNASKVRQQLEDMHLQESQQAQPASTVRSTTEHKSLGESSQSPVKVAAESGTPVQDKTTENQEACIQNSSVVHRIEEQIANVDYQDNITTQKNEDSNCVNKAVLTLNQDSFAISPEVPKTDSITVKPGNSVSTQTTLGSPEHRPMYIQMSSSTSTAYMSPPELILPTFLTHGYHVNVDESSMGSKRDASVTLPAEMSTRKRESSAKQCAHAKQGKAKSSSSSPNSKSKQTSKKIKAPPNSLQSTSSLRNYDNLEQIWKKKINTTTSFSRTSKKCRKCEKRADPKTNVKTHCRKLRQNNVPYKGFSGSQMRRINSMAAYLSRNQTFSSKNARDSKRGKTDLNPVIKWYVDKLLKLNREGLKAVKVMNQDCSTVSTPGSSIVNVPNNIDENCQTMVEAAISLEQIKQSITKTVLNKCDHHVYRKHDSDGDSDTKRYNIARKYLTRQPRRKIVHKVKSLNISRSLLSNKTATWREAISNAQSVIPTSETSSSRNCKEDKNLSTLIRTKCRSKSSPSPRRSASEEIRRNDNLTDFNIFKDIVKINKVSEAGKKDKLGQNNEKRSDVFRITNSSQDDVVILTTDYDKNLQQQASIEPLNISTQTSRIIDDEINFMRLAEDKLQNMEKIADLTERCTQRLSNLAKVLEEVRKNKSLAYSQVSDSASDIDRASGINSDTQVPIATYEPVVEIKEKSTPGPSVTNSANVSQNETNDLPLVNPVNSPPRKSIISPTPKPTHSQTPKVVEEDNKDVGYTPFLTDIPKPAKPTPLTPPNNTQNKTPQILSPNFTVGEHISIKSKGKPPPALSRRCLKRAPNYVIPHELSTVIEVDSPLSVKAKNHSARNDTDQEVTNTKFKEDASQSKENSVNPDLLQTNINMSRQKGKISSNDSSDDSRLQMMDLKQFNEIMLRPFISIQDYAKQCNIEPLEEGSNIENLQRDDAINDDLSSLHSDGSLPDVIAELLKRNIISEPFKFDSPSNVNSTTVSSESTLSVLALSKVKKDKKKSNELLYSNKENIESSDTLSMSSNPDLENAFKKLGMGWASSTLKKTKEHLALSSSSNTSSSSMSQFKIKSVSNQNFPALVTDSVSSVLNASNAPSSGKVAADCTKHAEQQTSMINSMTVKQFLNNELAKRITFTNKSRRSDREEEFVSLYETKIPEDMKHTSSLIREERSIDSNARARTSTPVQIFKSMTYHSSSSSNISNGLFSNADDLSSVKGTSNSMRNHSTSDKDDLTIPNFSLRTKKGLSDHSE